MARPTLAGQSVTRSRFAWRAVRLFRDHGRRITHATRNWGGRIRFAAACRWNGSRPIGRSEEHTSELQSLMRISYAVFCLQKKNLYFPKINYNILHSHVI